MESKHIENTQHIPVENPLNLDFQWYHCGIKIGFMQYTKEAAFRVHRGQLD